MLASDWTGRITQWRQPALLLISTACFSCQLVRLHRRSRGGLLTDHAIWLCRRA